VSQAPTDFTRFVEVFNDLEQFPTAADVAGELGISIKTVRNKAGSYRAMCAVNADLPRLILRATTSENPMSEDTGKFMEHWGPQECIEELQRVARKDLEMVVTRNYFRNHSAISESTWNRFFGTFDEFKRQAGIMLSRPQHALERAVAKHASVDHYRQLNIDRRDYGDRYEVRREGRFKTILACSDLHDEECDPFWLRVFIDTARRLQPHVIALVGDIFDLPEFGKYGVDPREWNVTARIRFVHEQILAPLREACPDAQFDFIEGNHEARLLKHLADQTPALRAVLADLHGMTVPKLLGLDRFAINYIAQADLAAFTKRDFEKELAANYKVYYDAFLVHHFPHARDMGLPGVNGHHHKHQVWPGYSPIYGSYEWHQMGCGHKRVASYCSGEKWHMGFDIVHIDTHTRATLHDYVTVSDFAVAGGQMYCRAPHEVDPAVIKPLHMNSPTAY
jgi:hypothetical protein